MVEEGRVIPSHSLSNHAQPRASLPIEPPCELLREVASSPSGLVVYQLFTLKETGVSPLVAQNFDEPVLVDGKPVRFAAAAFTVLENLKQQYYTANRISDATQAEWEGRTRRPPPEWKPAMRSTLADADRYPDTRGGRVFPAMPLAGIWATAAYLNNGSVANM
jgi:hypothetical protein